MISALLSNTTSLPYELNIQAGDALTTGNQNTVMGYNTLTSATTGAFNTCWF